MNETELLKELALRAGVAEPVARGVVLTLRELFREGRVHKDAVWFGGSDPRVHNDDAVDELITSARQHPSGVEFLLEGFLPSVAAQFRAHAFTVEAARERLRQEQAR